MVQSFPECLVFEGIRTFQNLRSLKVHELLPFSSSLLHQRKFRYFLQSRHTYLLRDNICEDLSKDVEVTEGSWYREPWYLFLLLLLLLRRFVNEEFVVNSGCLKSKEELCLEERVSFLRFPNVSVIDEIISPLFDFLELSRLELKVPFHVFKQFNKFGMDQVDWFLLQSGFLPELKQSSSYFVLLTEILDSFCSSSEASLKALALFLDLRMSLSESRVEDGFESVTLEERGNQPVASALWDKASLLRLHHQSDETGHFLRIRERVIWEKFLYLQR